WAVPGDGRPARAKTARRGAADLWGVGASRSACHMILGWLSRAFDRAPPDGRPFASAEADSAVVRLRPGERRRGQPGRRPSRAAGGGEPPVVIVFGVQPPPINGMSVVNAVIAAQVADRSCRVVIADISPRDTSGIRYHARRMGRVLLALA